MKNKITIGSRESKLAVLQSEMVRDYIKEHNPELEVEILTMKTTGDKILKNTPMEDSDRTNLLNAVDAAAGKVVNKLIFGLRDSLNQDTFLECVAGLEKLYEE